MLDADAMIGCGNWWEFLVCCVDRQYVRYAMRSKKIIRKNKQAINSLHFYLGMNSERFISLPALYTIFFLFPLFMRQALCKTCMAVWDGRLRRSASECEELYIQSIRLYTSWQENITVIKYGFGKLQSLILGLSIWCIVVYWNFIFSILHLLYLLFFSQYFNLRILSYIYSKLFQNTKYKNR